MSSWCTAPGKGKSDGGIRNRIRRDESTSTARRAVIESAHVILRMARTLYSFQKYFESRLRDVEKLPAALNAVQSQLEVQRNTRTSAENTVEILSKRLKTLVRISPNSYILNTRRFIDNNCRSLVADNQSSWRVGEKFKNTGEVNGRKYQPKVSEW